ncbi:MAG: polyprenyl synthetase family protein [Planctomycetota bacterium]
MPSFQDACRDRIAAVERFLLRELPPPSRRPRHLFQAARDYFERPGKRLRPCLVLLSASACGGDEDALLPAAAAVEVFHTWTLIHDDLIDRDDLRRGKPTVHALGTRWASAEFGQDGRSARSYGRDLAVLAGDLLQGWAPTLILRCAQDGKVPFTVACAQARRLARDVTADVLSGELLDVQLSRRPVEGIRRAEILRMMDLKTASLMSFCASLGASLALGVDDPTEPKVAALGAFARKCGLAFQVRDDILGIVADERALGKPVGSDLREKKRTILLALALSKARGADARRLKAYLAKPNPGKREVERVVKIFRDCGAVDAGARSMRRYLAAALRDLENVPPGEPRETLADLARFMAQRTF